MSDSTKSLKPPSGRAGLSLLVLFVPVVAAIALSGVYVDYRWFDSLDHSAVFTTVLATRWATGAVAGAFLGAALWLNMQLAIRWSRDLRPLYLHDPDGVPRVDLGMLARRVPIPVALAVAVLGGLACAGLWPEVAMFLHGGRFGTADSLFGNDIGFYIFRLPLLETGLTLLHWTIGLSAIASAALYLAGGALQLSERSLALHPRARAHLVVLGALFLAVVALDQFKEMYGLLYSDVGPVAGASYADVHAKLPALRIYAGLSAVGAGLLLASLRPRSGAGLILVAVALQAVGLLGVRFYPSLVHRFSVIPNELEKERPYLAANIKATRAAYDLDKVIERDLSLDRPLTAEDIRENHATVENIRLWDHQPLLDTFAQIQEIRTYYDFTSVDNDRYVIDGKLRQVMLSPRELAAESLPSRTWVNERFTFTHGYGLALGPVNEATPEGLPGLFVQDIPPVSKKDEVEVAQPSIYFGELSNDYVFVRTANREFDYPSGDGYVQTDYNGKAGIRFDSTLLRLALALKLGSIKVLLSNDIDSDSRVLLYRSVLERVRRIVPFARLDADPYMIVREDGSLMWICDAYLTSDRYPYAQPAGPNAFNYVRNSIKITVDAYDGTVTVYAVDERDPLLQAWTAFLPTTFTSLADMPPDVRSHLRYPVRIFAVQANIFATYHMREADLLYNREDQWAIPAVSSGEGTTQRMEPYYSVMRLPGEPAAEFILMLPFTPKRKDNLSAWMAGRSDGERLGDLVVYRFPKDRLIFGPQQIVNRINQDAEISRQISLWDQRGSDALFGTLLVIPVEESLLYVRPLYLRSAGGKIPELKRVIVAYRKRIAMEPSLAGALSAIFDSRDESPAQPGRRQQAESAPEADDSPAQAGRGSGARASGSEAGPPASTAAAALSHLERAIAAQRAGDWARYGAELQQVEAALRAMQPTTPASPAEDAGTRQR